MILGCRKNVMACLFINLIILVLLIANVHSQTFCVQGPPGTRGEQGIQGPVGEQGIQGIQGVPGDIGPQGENGTKGDVGPTGPTGDQGLVGERGEKGDTGPPGIDGRNGTDGIIGRDGVDGVNGTDGAKGDKGDTGDVGPQGERGEQGFNGTDGETGPTGPTGAVGPTGPQGEPGINGTDGEVGPQGDKGDTGDVGPTGAIGPTGSQGEQGLPGTPFELELSCNLVDDDPILCDLAYNNSLSDSPKTQLFVLIINDSRIDTDNPPNLQGDLTSWLLMWRNSSYPEWCDWIKLRPLTGVVGPTGPQGPQGEQGSKGDTGDQGIQGEKGDTGDIGPTGSQGEVGPAVQPLNITDKPTFAGMYLVDPSIIEFTSKKTVIVTDTCAAPFPSTYVVEHFIDRYGSRLGETTKICISRTLSDADLYTTWFDIEDAGYFDDPETSLVMYITGNFPQLPLSSLFTFVHPTRFNYSHIPDNWIVEGGWISEPSSLTSLTSQKRTLSLRGQYTGSITVLDIKSRFIFIMLRFSQTATVFRLGYTIDSSPVMIISSSISSSSGAAFSVGRPSVVIIDRGSDMVGVSTELWLNFTGAWSGNPGVTQFQGVSIISIEQYNETSVTEHRRVVYVPVVVTGQQTSLYQLLNDRGIYTINSMEIPVYSLMDYVDQDMLVLKDNMAIKTADSLAVALFTERVNPLTIDNVLEEHSVTRLTHGIKGAQGDIGPAGAQGEQGDPGGPTGPTGPTGDQGPKGDTGDQGLPGIDGETGPQGDIGPTGPAIQPLDVTDTPTFAGIISTEPIQLDFTAYSTVRTTVIGDSTNLYPQTFDAGLSNWPTEYGNMFPNAGIINNLAVGGSEITGLNLIILNNDPWPDGDIIINTAYNNLQRYSNPAYGTLYAWARGIVATAVWGIVKPQVLTISNYAGLGIILHNSDLWFSPTVTGWSSKGMGTDGGSQSWMAIPVDTRYFVFFFTQQQQARTLNRLTWTIDGSTEHMDIMLSDTTTTAGYFTSHIFVDRGESMVGINTYFNFSGISANINPRTFAMGFKGFDILPTERATIAGPYQTNPVTGQSHPENGPVLVAGFEDLLKGMIITTRLCGFDVRFVKMGVLDFGSLLGSGSDTIHPDSYGAVLMAKMFAPVALAPADMAYDITTGAITIQGGIMGPKGDQGPIGPTGPAGGPTGPTGDTGPTGPTGAAGADGADATLPQSLDTTDTPTFANTILTGVTSGRLLQKDSSANTVTTINTLTAPTGMSLTVGTNSLTLATTGTVTLPGILMNPGKTGSTQTAQTNAEYAAISVTWTGAWSANSAVDIFMSTNFAILSLRPTTFTCSEATSATATLPSTRMYAGFSTTKVRAVIKDAGVETDGTVKVGQDGVLTVERFPSTTFTAGVASCGWNEAIVITYIQ